jgi:hypothetical protein
MEKEVGFEWAKWSEIKWSDGGKAVAPVLDDF